MVEPHDLPHGMRSEAKNKRIEAKVEALTDEQMIEVLSSAKKRRAEAAETYDKGGRAELAEKERAEMVVIERAHTEPRAKRQKV